MLTRIVDLGAEMALKPTCCLPRIMNFHHPSADIYVPDGRDLPSALERVTHLGIGAHQDDLEFMAFHGITTCFDSTEHWFAGVTCCDGAGSARCGRFADFTDGEMRAVRRKEQQRAAKIGNYAAMLQLDFASAALRSPDGLRKLSDDLRQVLAATRPEVVYTHNPADKHDTHVAVFSATLSALRQLPKNAQPHRVIGCEVWRDLDWLPDSDKIVMDVSGYQALAKKLNTVFESQIAGGKRYDLAILGRRQAHATFFQSHATDQATEVIFGLDLTPLLADDAPTTSDYLAGFLEHFRADVMDRLARF